MPAPKPPAFETLSLHAGQHPDPVTRSRAVPIYQTTSYVFDDADHAAGLFNLERAGHIYSRISNPTTAVLEERIAALGRRRRRGVHGQRHGGDASRHRHAAGRRRPHRRLGLALRRHASISSRTRCRASASPRASSSRATSTASARRSAERRGWCSRRRIGNPGLEVLDIPTVAEIAHAAGMPLLIDNTFATPYLSRPIELGADLVMHSITKWIGGHGIAIGGAIVDGGRFDWQATGQIPDPDRALCRLSRHRLRRGVRPRRLHHARARRGPARFRRLPVADQRLPPAAGRRDAAAAHGAAHGEHGGGARLPAEERGGRMGAAPFARKPSRPRAGAEAAAEGRGLDRQLRHQGRPRRRRANSSRRCGSRAISPMSATPRRWSSIRPAPRTSRWTRRRSKAAGVGEELVRLSIGLEAASDILDDFAQALRASQKG